MSRTTFMTRAPRICQACGQAAIALSRDYRSKYCLPCRPRPVAKPRFCKGQCGTRLLRRGKWCDACRPPLGRPRRPIMLPSVPEGDDFAPEMIDRLFDAAKARKKYERALENLGGDLC